MKTFDILSMSKL